MISILELLTSIEIGLIYGIVAVGLYLTFRIIDYPDYTCDGAFTCGASVSAIAIKSGINPFLAIILSIISGGLCGLTTSILHNKFKVSRTLSGIITAFMLYSINIRIMGGVPNIAFLDQDSLFSIFRNSTFVIFTSCVLVWLLVSYVFITDFGLGLKAIGQNQKLSTISGIKIPFFTTICLIFSNSLIGLGGALFTQREGFSDISQGMGTVIIGLATIVIGEKISKYRNVWISIALCFIGSIIYRIIVSFALNGDMLGLKASDINLITGIIVVIIMWIPRFQLKTQLNNYRKNK